MHGYVLAFLYGRGGLRASGCCMRVSQRCIFQCTGGCFDGGTYAGVRTGGFSIRIGSCCGND
jgi:hypothetical protein